EAAKVDGSQVAGGVVEEHVFTARIRRADAAAGGAGMPFVDGRVVLCAWIGAAPGRVGDLVPNFAGRDALHDPFVMPCDQIPILVGFQAAEEFVGDADGVVGI